ncbi:MAG: threonyl-tRNA synthetase, partial [Gaiellaceae bacterium]|nr:threonyl-tRNA synthetase [Gaiellaceae bacterium]
TIQLDSQMPSRFGLKYVGPDNHEHDLYVVHRALYGSFERFIGILIEHYGGAFPFWLAPVQIRFVPVSDDHAERAGAVAARIREAGYRVEVDSSDETVGKRIRNAQVEKIPFTVVFGDRESEDSLAVRERGGEQSNPSLADFLATLATLGA